MMDRDAVGATVRRGYVQAPSCVPVFKESWELDEKNTVFMKAFIDGIDSTPRSEIARFMEVDGPRDDKPHSRSITNAICMQSHMNRNSSRQRVAP